MHLFTKKSINLWNKIITNQCDCKTEGSNPKKLEINVVSFNYFFKKNQTEKLSTHNLNFKINFFVMILSELRLKIGLLKKH